MMDLKTLAALTAGMSNGACIGYCITAMEKAGFDRGQIQKAVDELQQAFDRMETAEAESIWQNW